MKESRQCKYTLTVAFNMQKNLPLPQTNVTETYYSRQLWLYNLTFVVHVGSLKHVQSPQNVFSYIWTESDSGKGSNKVCSCLANFLRRIKQRAIHCRYKKLDLFSDSCPAQNKNKAMVALLLKYINSVLCPFKVIRFIFPMRGHSYLPADRVFGRIEKKVREIEVKKSPEDYYHII